MKKIALTFLFFLSLQAVFGDTAESHHRQAGHAVMNYKYSKAIFHYQRAAELYQQEGTKDSYILALYGLGYVRFLMKDYEKAMAIYEAGLELTEKLERKDLQAPGFFNIGLLHDTTGRYDKALSFFRKALHIDKELGRENMMVYSYRHIGHVYRHKKQYEKAVESYEAVLTLAERLDIHEFFIAGLSDIGRVHEGQRQWKRALEFYERGMQKAEELGLYDGIALCLTGLGSVHLALGEYDEAWESLDNALDLCRNDETCASAIKNMIGLGDALHAENRTWAALACSMAVYDALKSWREERLLAFDLIGPLLTSLEAIAQTHEESENFEKAGEFYEYIYEVVQSVDNRAKEADSLYHLALMLFHQERDGRANKCSGKSLAIYQELGDKEGILKNLLLLGEIHVYRDRRDRAMEAFRRALPLAEELGLDEQTAMCLNQLGNGAYAAQKYEKAFGYLQRALTISRRSKKDRWIALNLFNLGCICEIWKRHDEGAGYFQEALELSRNLRDEPLLAMNSDGLGRMHQAKGGYRKALPLFQEALSLYRKLGRRQEIPLVLNNIGFTCEKLEEFEEALQHFEESLELVRKTDRKDYVAGAYNNIAGVYLSWGRYDEAAAFNRKALKIQEGLDLKAQMASTLNNLGLVYNAWGDYTNALDFFQRSLALNRMLGEEEQIAISLLHIGNVYYNWGRYDTALESFEEALEGFRQSGSEEHVSRSLGWIGGVFQNWGRYDESLEFYGQALEIAKNTGVRGLIAGCTGNIGSLYHIWGKYDLALQHYEQALAIHRELGAEKSVAVCLGNIGIVYQDMGQPGKAEASFKQALEVSERLGIPSSVVGMLNSLGSLYMDRKQYDLALKHFDRAFKMTIEKKLGVVESMGPVAHNLATLFIVFEDYEEAIEILQMVLRSTEKLKAKALAAKFHTSLGIAYYHLNNFEKAYDNFVWASHTIEQLRLTAAGELRRDYLAAQISTYRWLASLCIRNGLSPMALDTVEHSSAKYLIEQLGEKMNEQNTELIEAVFYQQTIPEDLAILNFANVNWSGSVARIHAEKNRITGSEISVQAFTEQIQRKYGKRIAHTMREIKGLRMRQKKSPEQPEASDAFDDIVNYYRHLLSRPDLRKVEEKARDEIGRALYTLLFEGLEEKLQDKRELLILPGDILAFLPFEALIMQDGRYLVERYDVRYCQSLSVLELLKKRRYPPDRESLLAFGGAVYEESSYKKARIQSEQQLDALRKSSELAMTRGLGVGEAYDRLGYGRWSNLPGSLAEVRRIQQTVSGSEVVTGPDVDEAKLKKLSSDGSLKRYRVIHFATHGLVVPQIPELSALVLSQLKNETGDEDGYLRMGEIVGLNMEADFVALSACETGLGKIYGGEGVVGLTQAFLVGGANGLSVSLWQVADESTFEFMVGMYGLVNEESMSYSRAISEMKRRFLKGRYEDPFFWAPFVYYGR